MFLALGSIMESRGRADDSEQQRHQHALQRLQEYYLKFADEPAFIDYLKREWENKIGKIPCPVHCIES